MILDKATRENNLKFVQATHYQMAEIFMLCKNDWNQARIHLKKMFSVRIDDGDVVVNEVRSGLINVFSTMRDLLTSKEIDEDQFHSIMADVLNKFISLYHHHSAKPLSSLDYLLIIDRLNYIGWVRKRQHKLSEAWDSHERALQLLREHLPPTHPRLAITYNHIGSLHSMMNNHLSALDIQKKSVTIKSSTFG